MKKFLLSVSVSVLLASNLSANVNNQTGCGLGSQLIKDDSSAIMLALQATTNGTSGNQTFGITLGTSGCEKKKLVINERTQEFVASNMDQISKEIAIGKGESIETLAELLNISDKATFAANLQSNYNAIYTSSKVDMADVLTNIKSI